MSLSDHYFELEYNPPYDQVVEDFYIPALKEGIMYKRAVGFFSSSILLQLTKGLGSLAERGGKMKLLVSTRLSSEDYDAIEKGYDLKQYVLDKVEADFGEFEEFEQKNDRLGMLSYMVSSGFLDIKIVALERCNDKAMYHEKLGIISDLDGNTVSFSGSANDTNNAINLNYESIDVYCSWKSTDSSNRCLMKETRFDNMWNNLEKGVVVIDFPDVIKNKILKCECNNYEFSKIDEDFLKEYNDKKNKLDYSVPDISSLNGLYDYQKDAIRKWESNDYKGIFDMATGTGKTFAGCGAITQLYHKKKRLISIICCPYTHLADQWEDEVKIFGIEAIKCYSEVNYKKKLERYLKKYKHRFLDFICIIVVNATFSGEYFQSLIKGYEDDILLVVDEAHNFGSYKLSKCLDVNYKYRLALSATLERYGDEVGTKVLYDYFGEKCISYSLDRAIREHKLTPYKYYPIPVFLNGNELDNYIDLTNKISKAIVKNPDSDYVKSLLIKRARLIAGAENKLDVLEELVNKYKNDNNMLVYCGAVKYGEEGYACDIEGKKQIQKVSELLNNKLGMTALKFTSEEDKDERKRILNAFKSSDIQALIAIKCLDEGMNVPAIKTAFIMASSTNPKEYIQRRGRVLRLSDNKKYAEIYDFITLPVDFKTACILDENQRKSIIGLVKRELIRMIDFNSLALESSKNNDFIELIKESYGLYKIDINEGVTYD